VNLFTRSAQRAMTERKPPGVTWETWIDRQIRVGMERGAFDDLPGHGKPVPDLDKARDELWWVRDKVRRENATHVPPAVQVRRELDATLAAISGAPSEQVVRDLVAGINERVRWVNSRPISGPPSTVAPLDAEAEVRAWRASRPPAPDVDHAAEPVEHEPGRPGPGACDDAGGGRRPRWWRVRQSSTRSER
jgi:Domain of unknown function (DUF1992)